MRKCVLIADDDATWRQTFGALADVAKVDHTMVSDWVGVYAQLNRRRPDAIILDLMLNCNVQYGIDELAKLAEKWTVPIYIATAWIDDKDAKLCLDIPAVQSLLRKPKFFERLDDICEFLGYSPDPESLRLAKTANNLRFLQKPEASVDRDTNKKVFVVYGRNAKLREGLFEFLRSLELQPIEWVYAVALTGDPASSIKTILEAALRSCGAVLVVLSADDKVRLRSELCGGGGEDLEKTYRFQSRPNVFYELGLALATRPGKVVIATSGTSKVFSDIEGIYMATLNNSSESRNEIVGLLSAAGCHVNTRGVDWLRAGDLSPL